MCADVRNSLSLYAPGKGRALARFESFFSKKSRKRATLVEGILITFWTRVRFPPAPPKNPEPLWLGIFWLKPEEQSREGKNSGNVLNSMCNDNKCDFHTK